MHLTRSTSSPRTAEKKTKKRSMSSFFSQTEYGPHYPINEATEHFLQPEKDKTKQLPALTARSLAFLQFQW